MIVFSIQKKYILCNYGARIEVVKTFFHFCENHDKLNKYGLGKI